VTNHLYRFRSTQMLLGEKYQELERQEIYFCPPDKLNDPLEGFKDVFWRGDRALWSNLLSHYMLCLLETTGLVGMLGPEFKQDLCTHFVHQTPADIPDAPIRGVYEKAVKKFLRHRAARDFVEELGKGTQALRKDELVYFLRVLHPIAMVAVITSLRHLKIELVRNLWELLKMTRKAGAQIKQAIQFQGQVGDASCALGTVHINTMVQLDLIHAVNNEIPTELKGWMFLNRDFAEFYVKNLERLIFPDWYAACFVADPTNSSMWGVYGNGHSGICLKFKTRESEEASHSLPLRRPTDLRGIEGLSNHDYRRCFDRIQYTAEFPEIDFFRSLGSLSIPKLSGFWYAAPDGGLSDIGADILSEKPEWRESYWNNFHVGFNTKSPEWAHEEEYRLILTSSLTSFDSIDERKLKYNFSDLSGLIFGMNTSFEDKLHVMRIIEGKCVAENRDDFEFFQAHYSHQKRKIEILPLRLLKIKQPANA